MLLIIDPILKKDGGSKIKEQNCVCTTHLGCHSLLMGKVLSALAAKAQWSSHKSRHCHTGRSSSQQRMQKGKCECFDRRGSQGLQRKCRCRQKQEGMGGDRANLVRRY